MSKWEADLCSDVAPEVLDWLWPGYVPRGKLVLLDGDPEMGKSLLTIDLIARLSRGGPLPDGAPVSRAHTSVLISAEDGRADTIRPRAEAAGADLSRLILPNFGGRVPRFPEEIANLEELIVDRGVDLVVLDPLMAFLPPSVAANLDQCVRQALTPLSQLAFWTGCTILLVRHLTKKWRERALLRGQGSVGIAGAVRSGLLVGPHPGPAGGEPGGPPAPRADRVLAVYKTNLGARPPSLGYRVVRSALGPPVVEWTGPVAVTADELGASRPADAGLPARERAVDWLRRELAGGPRRAADVSAAAAAAGIPDRTLNRAKADLRAESHREYDYRSRRGEWWWYDPAAAWPKDAPFQRPVPKLPEFPPPPRW